MAEAATVSHAAPPAELGCNPDRLFAVAPASGGWRENLEPVSGLRYWTHVAMRLTTWSMVELLRLNGLEEFLQNGEWSIFTCVPEDPFLYEDKTWGLDLYANDRLEGKPVLRLKRGTVVASTGMPRQGICELLVPSSEDFVLLLYAPYRFPKDTGARLMQKLPASQFIADAGSLAAITVPSFIVLPGAAGDLGLPVTAERNPRSPELGRLPAGCEVFLRSIVGTRAQLSRGGGTAVFGGWISLLGLDATPTLERTLPESESRKMAAQLEAHIKELEERGEVASRAASMRDDGQVPAELKVVESTTSPPLRSKIPVEQTEQRPTVTGGWRQVVDPIWNRPYFVEPVAGRLTWGLGEVLRTGGLDDLLLARDWEICVVDPLAEEHVQNPNWLLEIFADPALTGDPLTAKAKGELIIVQLFDAKTYVAEVLVPPSREGEQAASAFARYRLPDGRPLLRAVLPPAVDEYAAAVASFEGEVPAEKEGAEPPPGPVLEGPYFSQPPGTAPDLPVSIGQDLGSDRWARLPRGYCIRTFAEVLGLRARLPDLEGGGWVSIFGTDGTAYFQRRPSQPPTLAQAADSPLDEEDQRLPAVWPGLGVLWPAREPVAKMHELKQELPELLQRLSGGRVLCDWNRLPLPPDGGHFYKSPHTLAQTTLHDLLRLKVWKASVVEATELEVREYGDPRSSHLATLPWGAIIVAEWVTPTNAVRLLLPGEANADKPLHAWADLGSGEGTSLAPLVAGKEFWVEPKGGHLPDEAQTDEDQTNFSKVMVREAEDRASKEVGFVQRGDAVTLAEVHGRYARVVHSRRVTSFETVPSSGGWIDVFDDAGWGVLRLRRPGEIHIEEIRKRPSQEVPEEVHKKRSLQQPRPSSRQSASSSGRRSSSRVSVSAVTMPGALSLMNKAEGITEQTEEEEIDDESGSGFLMDVPPLLMQIGELERRSVNLRDWREHRDPVWGRRYYVNRWSGQIIHKLADYGVSQASVRLTLYLANLSKNVMLKDLPGKEVDERMASIERSLCAPMSAIADVPEDLVTVRCAEGEEAPEGSQTRPPSPPAEDSERSVVAGASAEEKASFRIVVQLKAPGTRCAWASAALKRAMGDSDRFNCSVVTLVCSTPNMLSLLVDLARSVELIRADLEEMEIPRTATCLRPQSPESVKNAAPPPLPIDDDIRDLSKNMVFRRPKLLQMPNRALGPPTGNAQELADGLSALPEPTLEEVGLWKCYLGDAGAVSLANALSGVVGAKLHTLLLDENRIGAAGATALGAALKNCGLLRELGVARNPLGPGFAALVGGLGSALVVFDASDTLLDDDGVRAAAASMPRWPSLKSLRLSGNANLGIEGLEALVKAAAECKSLRLADVKGCSPTVSAEWPRYSQMLVDAGREPALVRL